MSNSYVLPAEQLQDLKNMLDLSILSYNVSKSQLCSQNDTHTDIFNILSEKISFIPSLLIESRTISILSQDNKTLYIAFAGTHDVNDEVSDVEFLQVYPQLESNEVIKFHEGFYIQFTALKINITLAVQSFMACGGTNICLIGHSSGGCVASITAYYLKQILQINNIKVMTFGSPYFTNFAGASWFEINCAYTRVEIDKDPVPSIPTLDIELERYFHIKTTYLFIKNNTVFLNKPHVPISVCNFVIRLIQRRMNIYYHRTQTYKNKLDNL